jgi:hypothetical protein
MSVLSRHRIPRPRPDVRPASQAGFAVSGVFLLRRVDDSTLATRITESTNIMPHGMSRVEKIITRRAKIGGYHVGMVCYPCHARGFTPLALSVGYSIKEIGSVRLGRMAILFAHGTAGDGDDRQGNGACSGDGAGLFFCSWSMAKPLLFVMTRRNELPCLAVAHPGIQGR